MHKVGSGHLAEIETSRRKIVSRLKREGWQNKGGGEHDVFRKAGHPVAVVPRHSTLSTGVARTIAKAARWI